MGEIDFDTAFQALTDNPPFPWQRALYRRFLAGEFPASCNLPTGLGKTSVTMQVRVEAERGGQVLHVTQAELVYVGVDLTTPDRRPRPLLPG